MQFQTDLLGIPVDRPEEKESTALGAALMAAISLGVYEEKEIEEIRKSERHFLPAEETIEAQNAFRRYQTVLRAAIEME